MTRMQGGAIRGALLLIGALALAAAAEEDFIGVVATDYVTGKFHAAEPDDPWDMLCDVQSACPDAVARYHGGLVYLVNRRGCDNIQVLDPEQGFAIVREFSVGGGSNPQDIAFAPDGSKAYVPRQNADDVLVVDPATGAWLGAVDLSAWNDADGSCEPGGCLLAGERIFAAVLRLDRDFYWLPVGDSYLAVIDPVSDTLVDADAGQPGIQAVSLLGTNPAWELNLDPEGMILASCVGAYGLWDGGLERVDPVALSSLGYVVSEAALDGDIGDAVIVDESLAYAVVGDANFDTQIKRFDPGTGGGVELFAAGAGYVFFDLELDSTGELYVADQSFDAWGLRIYDADTGELLKMPDGSCLPPYDILVPREGGTGIGEAPALPDSRLSAWPNPFNPSTTLRWGGLLAGFAELSIHDLAGRRLATLFAGEQNGGGELTWRGRDEAGRRLASGVYMARVSAGGRTLSERLVLIK